MGKITSHPTFQKISWISVGVTGLFVMVGAIWLAVRAQATDPPPAIKETSADVRPGRAVQRPARPVRPDRRPPAPGATLPRPARVNTEAAVEMPPTLPPSQPDPPEAGDDRHEIGYPALPSLRNVERTALDSRAIPGRLSPEELAKRRDERRSRQEERLKERIRTLEERIQSYRQDGSRTEAQIERMERSLERMRQRASQSEDPGALR